MAEIILTREGVRELEEKLEYLKTVARKEIAEQIKVAREFGDISENAEYDEAKNEQSRIEGEIVDLEKKLRNATVIDASDIDTDTVGLGATVTVKEAKANGETMTFTIVGSTEASPANGRISNESPVGAALLGQKVGAEVAIHTPGGIDTYQILSIKRN